VAALLFAGYSFFYVYVVAFCLVDIVWKRWRRVYLWLPFVLLALLVGPYLYFEKFIFPTYLRGKTRQEKANEPPPVVIAATPKALWRRAAAALLDFTLLFAFFSIYTMANGTRGADGIWRLQGGPHILLFLAVWFFYLPLSETIWAKTLGKALFGVKVIMLQGGTKVTFAGALKRHLLDFVDLMIVLGVFAFAVSRGTMPRRLGDRWARTVVTLDEWHQEQIDASPEPVQLHG
jgi:uncharacterized RDD family membrane protein YckC